MATQFYQMRGWDDPADFAKAGIEWEKQKQVITSLIKTYFSSSSVQEEWEKCQMLADLIYSLYINLLGHRRRDLLRKIKKYFPVNLTESVRPVRLNGGLLK